jgi:exopolyphosphatase/guanosine-5'-triphosphate,3'-diphosphate pyrophosphatase
MRIAIIDLGTNTFNLLIGEIDENKNFRKLFSNRIAVKLGENGINSGIINPIPFQRGVEAMVKINYDINAYSCKVIKAFATSAVRSAENGIDFIAKIKNETGIEVEVISGDREAELIYLGNKAAVKLNKSFSLIMDIGGGSTEFIIANENKIFWKKSFLLGAARLLDKFNPSDPIQLEEVQKIQNYWDVELFELNKALKNWAVLELIGSSGAFDSIVEMLEYRYGKMDLKSNKTEFTVDVSDFLTLNKELLKSTVKQRLAMKGLLPMRVDMIVISSLFIEYIITKYSITHFRVSGYSLKEGVIAELIKGRTI